MSSISTHVIDTANGSPATGMALRLLAQDGSLLFEGVTDEDGRCKGLPAVTCGRFTITFAVADYFRARGAVLPDPPFIDVVRIDFGVADADGHYHVPLLASPFGYSTYRGS